MMTQIPNLIVRDVHKKQQQGHRKKVPQGSYEQRDCYRARASLASLRVTMSRGPPLRTTVELQYRTATPQVL